MAECCSSTGCVWGKKTAVLYARPLWDCGRSLAKAGGRYRRPGYDGAGGGRVLKQLCSGRGQIREQWPRTAGCGRMLYIFVGRYSGAQRCEPGCWAPVPMGAKRPGRRAPPPTSRWLRPLLLPRCVFFIFFYFSASVSAAAIVCMYMHLRIGQGLLRHGARVGEPRSRKASQTEDMHWLC